MSNHIKPLAIRKLEGMDRGHRSKEKLNVVEPMPPLGSPDEPEMIRSDPVAHTEWQELCESLDAMGLLAKTDKALLTMYAKAWSDFVRTQADVAKYGDKFHHKASGYIQVSPQAVNRNAAFEQLRKCLAELGLTPAARARMRVPAKGKQEDNPWSQFLA